MRLRIPIAVFLATAAILSTGVVASSQAADTPPPAGALAALPADQLPSVTDYSKASPDPAHVREALDSATKDGSARVVVTVRAVSNPLGSLSSKAATTQLAAFRSLQDQAVAAAPKAALIRRFDTLPFLVVQARPDDIKALASSAAVADVQLDRLVSPALSSTTPLIGSSRLNSRGIGGAGQTIAIVDTGVDTTHPFLAGRVVDEACFGGCFGANVTSGPGTGGNCPLTIAGCNHGTHVAGIAAGAAGANPIGFNGVAPQATIMSVNVFHRVDNFWPFTPCGSGPSPCVSAWTSDIVAGLEFVYSRRTIFTIAAVNLSIGDGWENSSPCGGSWTKPVIDNLASAGIATVVAAGNDGHTNGLSEPACVASAVSVGATDNSDAVAGFSNSASYLDLLAPGVNVTSSVPGGGFAMMTGTSMAAPHVAGAFALLKQKYPAAGVAELQARLAQTGVRVTDPKSGVTTPRINVERAAQYPMFTSDFTRDLHADNAVWRPSTGDWWVPGQATFRWGVAGDKPVPGDYNGDGVADKAIWRPSTGQWWVPGMATVVWGVPGDVPVPADYNNDGITDLAVWRPSTGEWWIRGVGRFVWGGRGDVAVPADYDGNGTADIAIWRPSTGEWWIPGRAPFVWGGIADAADIPVPADYDGNGTADIAIWRPGTGDWWVAGQFTQRLGANGDIPNPRDVTGDGRADLTVFTPGTGTWTTFFRFPLGVGGFPVSTQWGASGDVPVGPTGFQLR